MLQITRKKISELHADPANVRRHSDRNLRAIRDSIVTFGQVEPLVIQKSTGKVIGGNGRLESMIAAGDDECDVVEIEIDDVRAAALAIALNRTAELAEWDDSALASMLATVQNADAELAKATGFDASEIEKLTATPPSDVDAEPQITIADQLKEKWGVETGQLWALGDHRLLCGDSTDTAVVKRVMGNDRVALCLTDPPYGLDDSATSKNNYATYIDSMENLRKLIDGAIIPLIGKMRVVLTPGNKNHYEYPRPSWTMAWFCPAGVGSGPWGFCCWQPIMCYGKDAKLASGKGSHPDALVHQEGPSSDAHPCAKPMKFWAWLLDRVSDAGDVVFDPFMGSGTTIIACEQFGRICVGIEIEPGYVAVTLQRWADATGKTPTLIT